MKRLLIISLVLLISKTSYSQNFPKVKFEEKSELKLDKLIVEAEVSGNYVTVSYDMTFYNGLDRVLEGELAFPLAQGQSVSHFAMDLNGQLRTAVVVEKELGRVAYENTIKQRIDPALLEQTQGNNYKARVYPIPARGYKRIVVTYEQNLGVNDGFYHFNIPFQINTILTDFKIKIKCNNQNLPPVVSAGFKKQLKFTKKGDDFIGKFEGKSFTINSDLNIKIPIKDVIYINRFEEYFHLSKIFSSRNRPKKTPKSLTILWDASYSMQYKRFEDEFNLLTEYLKYLGDTKVTVITFSNTIISNRTYKIKNGVFNELVKDLEETKYDGGTSYKNLPILKSDEILLFSDGLHNLGELDIENKAKLFCINSVNSANHQLLETLSTDKGGNYINLNSVAIERALDLLKNESFQFLGANHENTLFEMYPKPNTVVNENFTLSGKYLEAKPIELLFGYGDEITERILVDMSSSSNSTTTKRLWTKAKLKHLSKNKKENKDKIIEHAKNYDLISAYTSMIVLDRIEDYLRYKIEPPSELKVQYNQMLARTKDEEMRRMVELKDRREELREDYEIIRNRYNKDFVNTPSHERKKTKKTKASSTLVQEEETNRTSNSNLNDISTNIDVESEVASAEGVIFGNVVASNDNLPLPGVNVIVKGTSRGVTTDFDGNFMINAAPNEILTISYVGMITTEYRVNSEKNVDIILNEQSNLDEVVVVGYAASTKESFSSVSSISAENIRSENGFSKISQSLAGEAAGVEISQRFSQTRSASNVKIRGVGSVNSNNEPMYIIDGLPFDGNLSSISPDNIVSIAVIKDSAAQEVYGSRGANGIVVITTIDGSKSNEKAIDDKNIIVEKSILKSLVKNVSYMEYLNEQETIEDAYNAYCKIRERYKTKPSFYLDVAEFFETKNRIDIALRIATNLIEIELDNHELLRALAYKLEQYKKYDLAVYVYQNVLDLRPEHPQSYRDLALAYESNNMPNEAMVLLLKLIKGDLLEKDEGEIFYGIEKIAYVELCHLVNSIKALPTKELKETYKPFETDIRVVVDWNHGETDIDLYIKNPAGEVIYYGNDMSKYGGSLSEDMTEGYGPETFWIKKAQKGNYEVSVNYYTDRVQKINGPTSLKITIYKNYGKPNEVKNIKVLRLSEDTKKLVEKITI